MDKKARDRVQLLDRVMYIMGIAIPILTSSQVIKIWLNKNADGVSLIAWITYAFNSILWVIYGKLHKKKPIIFTNIVSFIINIMVVIGVIIYS
ncbi:MAG: SemiSWEET family transporter [Patescibacteria group bacterium]